MANRDQPPPTGQQPGQQRVTNDRFPVATGPGSEARSTLIMSPGEVPGLPAAPTHKKDYGKAAPVEKRTVIMMPEEAQAAAASRQQAPQAPSQASHPVSQDVQPPEIELVQHEIPTDTRADSRLILFNDPDSEQAAAFRVLRHHVLERGNPRIIAVSGPTDGCGKTTTAINLAMALAECGRTQTLLVDANLRNPKLASIFRFVPPWCFAAQLEQHREQPFLPWGLVEIPSMYLHIAAIDPRSERRQRIDAPAFAIAMDRLRLGPYQHIVVDCPSILGSADVNLIQDATDGVLLAARQKTDSTHDIRQAVDQMTPTKILGSVLLES